MHPTTQRFVLNSKHLDESRILHTICGSSFRQHDHRYAVFCADGQMLSELVASVTDPILAGCLFVGIESNPETRNYDYIQGYLPDRFHAHERFVTDEVLPLIDQEYGIHDSRCLRGVCGVSNGATLAHSLAARNASHFSFAVIFSAADNRVPREQYPTDHSSRYYLAAGTLEPEYLEATKSIVADLRAVHAAHKFVERNADHTIAFWASELPTAIEWIKEP